MYVASMEDPRAESAVPVLIEMLKDEQTGTLTQTSAAELLGQIGPPAEAALPILKKKAKSQDEGLRRTAEWALRRIRGE